MARARHPRSARILLDEPVAHLDAPTARAVIDDLVTASEGRTLVMVSHREDGRDAFVESSVLPPQTTGQR